VTAVGVAGQGRRCPARLQSRAGLTTLANFYFEFGKLEGSTACAFRYVLQQVTPFLPFFDPGWIDYKFDHLMHFVLETLFVRLILSARIDSPLLIRLVGCHAESFSNEQGQELDNNLMTSYNDLAQ
jgi:hypothetical protein